MTSEPYLVTPKLHLASSAELQSLQAWLGLALPIGYADHVTRLGRGTYGGRVIVRMPADVPVDTPEEQAFVREWFDEFWGEGSDIAADEAAQGIAFAYSVDGDKIFYSRQRQQLFVLPRHDDRVYWMPHGFTDPLNWGKGEAAHTDLITFDSGVDRAVVNLFTAHALDVPQVAQAIAQHAAVAHRQDASWGVRLYLPDLYGSAQLSKAPGDTRVSVRIDYDHGLAARVAPVLQSLVALGMFITDDTRAAWPSV